MCKVYGRGLRVGESTVSEPRGRAKSRRATSSPDANSVALAEIWM